MKSTLYIIAAGLALFVGAASAAAQDAANRPNIVWLSTEDIGLHLGCYGDPHAVTPTLDRLAAEGIRYTNAYTAAPVCAPNRSCIITGMYQTTLGTHHMRSGGEGRANSAKPKVPGAIRFFPEYLRDAGYYCTNNRKEDYQFPTPPAAWDESSGKAHWRNRPNENQPFFAVFNFTGTHESQVRLPPEAHRRKTKMLEPEQRQDPDAITPPPYHPNTPIVRRNWADYYEAITVLDHWVAGHLEALEEAGLAGDTIVIFWSDHGMGLPRGKRWIHDTGTHIPLIARIPERWRTDGSPAPGTVTGRLVSAVDFAPTTLRLAGVHIPGHMQGQPFLGSDLPAERNHVYAARDRMDERYDMMRMVHDKRYLYIRNYKPYKPYYQHIAYGEHSPIKKELHRLAAENALPSGTEWFTVGQKPVEELYDTVADPHNMNNLAADPVHQPALQRLRNAHEEWTFRTNDLGYFPEPVLFTLGRNYGTRYAILPELHKRDPDFLRELRAVAIRAGRPTAADTPVLLEILDHQHESFRYWSAVGLGNLEGPTAPASTALKEALDDTAPVVRVAAARALFKHGTHKDAALAVLAEEFERPHEWIRLQAALALDAIDEAARPVIPLLKHALHDKENKYVAHVLNRALKQLESTDQDVR